MLYQESQEVTIAGGVFNIEIGSQSPIPQTLTFDQPYFLGVSVDGNPEMTPRTALSTAPYAFSANIAELAESDSRKAGDASSPDGTNVSAFPFAVTREVLSRGRERYDIFCAPCHGLAGDGDGVIVQRGFRAPPSYHLDRLRSAPASHFFDVITSGFGAMYPYGYRVPIADRWAIVAYIRALQLSRQGTIDEVPPAERQKLMSEPQ